MTRILLLGPNRWPANTTDPEAGLRLRREIIADNTDLAAEWVLMDDSQGKSPYLYNILARGVYEQEWTDLPDLKNQIQEVLRGDLGVPTKRPR